VIFSKPTEKKLLNKIEKKLVKRRIEALKSIPSCGKTASIVTQLIEEGASAGELSKVIEQDVVLCFNLLKLVNSAFYGFEGEISSIRDAIVLLGTEVVRGLILSTALTNNDSPLVIGMWEHSFGAACFAGVIARHLGLNNSLEVSAAALLHDVGKLVILNTMTEEYGECRKTVSEKKISFFESELSVIGVDHAQIGHWLALKWNLPSKLSEPIAYHHKPNDAKKSKLETAIVHYSDIMIRAYGFGFGGDPFVPEPDKRMWRLLELNEKDLVKIYEETEKDIFNAMTFANDEFE